MHGGAAAAFPEHGAVRLDPVGGGSEKLLAAAPYGSLVRLDDAHAPALVRQCARHEYGASSDAAHAAAVRGKGIDLRFIDIVFLQFG